MTVATFDDWRGWLDDDGYGLEVWREGNGIAVSVGACVMDLTPTQAREVAAHLVALADAAEGGDDGGRDTDAC